MPESSHAVFLSYASQDAQAAQQIAEALRAGGVEVFFDQSELRGGDAWDRAIRDRIHDCRLFIAVISVHTEARDEGYFRREWALAVDRTRDMDEKKTFLVPVVIDDTSKRAARVPEKFHGIQWTRLPGGETPPEFVERVRSLLSPEPAHMPRAAISPAQPVSTMTLAVGRTFSRPNRALLAIVAVVVLGAAAYVAVEVFSKHTESPPAPLAAPASAAQTFFSPPPHSIAVLPFVDMSEKHDQEYFSDGLSEELIDLLSRTPDLRVTARTSSFQFKGRNEDVRLVARQLGVANVLEGSVRKSGATMRVTVQLIKASDGSHAWSETYDRRLDDIFKVQDDICGTVVKALKLALTPSERTEAVPQNMAAYDAMLRGRHFAERFTKEDTGKAIVLLQEAIRLEPTYAQAWVELAEIYRVRVDNGWAGVSEEDGYAQVRSAADRALQLDPKVSKAHGILAQMLMWADYDWAGAQAQFALEPDGPGNQVQMAQLPVALGRLDESIDLLRQALLRDPLSNEANYSLAIRLLDAGRAEQAESQLRKLLEILPLAARIHEGLGLTFLARGRYVEALDEMQHETDDGWRKVGLPLAYWAVGRRAEADAALEALKAQHADDAAYQIAETYAYRGEKDLAFAWLDRTYRQRDPGMFRLKTDFLFQGVRSDPRYKALLREMNLPG